MAIQNTCGAQVMEEEQDTPLTLPSRKKLAKQDGEILLLSFDLFTESVQSIRA